MMTEEEARGKWCPFSRSDNHECGSNRQHTGEPDAGTLCIASDCMLWEWGGEEREERRVYLDIQEGYQRTDGLSAILHGERWIYRHTDVDEGGRFDLIERRKSNARPIGRCGLAGHP